MTLVKIVPFLVKYRAQLLKCNSLVHLRRYKSGRETAISKTTRSEVDTRIKPLGEKVKETTKTASYLGIILLGVGVTGSLFYVVFSELFSNKSPNNVYSRAVERCKDEVRVQDKLGLPITAFGEETRRRRRQHVSHVVYERDGRQCIRMKFYLKGTFHKATVQLEMIENDFKKYEYRYMFLEVDDLQHTTIVLEDNRSKFEQSSPGTTWDLANLN